MDLQAVLAHVETWPVEARLQLVERVWDSLVDAGHVPALTEAQKAEIDRRLAEDDASPDDVIPWEVVKAEALARAAR